MLRQPANDNTQAEAVFPWFPQVTVRRFYVAGSVEERIMEVVKQRRQAMAGSGTNYEGEPGAACATFRVRLGGVPLRAWRLRLSAVLGCPAVW